MSDNFTQNEENNPQSAKKRKHSETQINRIENNVYLRPGLTTRISLPACQRNIRLLLQANLGKVISSAQLSINENSIMLKKFVRSDLGTDILLFPEWNESVVFAAKDLVLNIDIASIADAQVVLVSDTIISCNVRWPNSQILISDELVHTLNNITDSVSFTRAWSRLSMPDYFIIYFFNSDGCLVEDPGAVILINDVPAKLIFYGHCWKTEFLYTTPICKIQVRLSVAAWVSIRYARPNILVCADSTIFLRYSH